MAVYLLLCYLKERGETSTHMLLVKEQPVPLSPLLLYDRNCLEDVQVYTGNLPRMLPPPLTLLCAVYLKPTESFQMKKP